MRTNNMIDVHVCQSRFHRTDFEMKSMWVPCLHVCFSKDLWTLAMLKCTTVKSQSYVSSTQFHRHWSITSLQKCASFANPKLLVNFDISFVWICHKSMGDSKGHLLAMTDTQNLQQLFLSNVCRWLAQANVGMHICFSRVLVKNNLQKTCDPFLSFAITRQWFTGTAAAIALSANSRFCVFRSLCSNKTADCLQNSNLDFHT